MGRGADAVGPTAEAVHAVMGSLTRHHELVLVDGGRTPAASARQALRAVDATVVLSGAGVRDVAATARVADGLGPAGLGLVVRGTRGGPPGGVVADALGLPLWGEVPADRRLAADAEAGGASRASAIGVGPRGRAGAGPRGGGGRRCRLTWTRCGPG